MLRLMGRRISDQDRRSPGNPGDTSKTLVLALHSIRRKKLPRIPTECDCGFKDL